MVLEEKKVVQRYTWRHRILRSLIFLVLLFLLAFILLQIPAVQTMITKSIVSSLTKKMDGEVHIGRTSLDIQQGVSLQDVMITSDRDTLLQIAHLGVSPRNTLIGLISGGLQLSSVSFDGVQINVKRRAGQAESNWQRFLRSNDNETATSGSKLPEIGHLRLFNFELSWADDVNGEYISGEIGSVELDVKEINLSQAPKIHLDRILLLQPDIRYQKRQVAVTDSIFISSIGDDPNTSTVPQINVDRLMVIDGSFRQVGATSEMYLRDADLSVANLKLDNEEDWSLQLEELSGDTPRGNVQYASIQNVRRDQEQLLVENALINLDQTRLRLDGQINRLKGWANTQDASLSLKVAPSIIYLEDLDGVIGGLEKLSGDPLLHKKIQIEGDIIANKDRLYADQLRLWVDGVHHFKGAVSFDRAEILKESQLNVQVDQLVSDMYSLDKLSKTFRLPAEVLRLGQVDFKGSFDGFLNDFVANGVLMSPLGNANMDIKFDLSGQGELNVLYDGFLSLDSFDLAAFTLNENFGKVSASMNLSDGMGTSFLNSSANINAVLGHFEYLDYTYEDALFQGRLSSKVIDGYFQIEDDELSFKFDGVVDLSTQTPVFDFKIDAKKINFCQLNLSDFPCELSFASDINLTGGAINTLDGSVHLTDIQLQHDTSSLLIKDISVLSRPGPEANSFELKSDFLDFDIEGRFNLLNAFQNSFHDILEHVKEHNKVWGIKTSKKGDQGDHYRYSLLLKEATPVFEFLNIPIIQMGYASITGGQTETGHIDLTAVIPKISYDVYSAESIRLSLLSMDTLTVVSTTLANIAHGEDVLQSYHMDWKFVDDIVDWGVHYQYDEANLGDIYISSQAMDNGYITDIVGDYVLIDSSEWDVVSKEKIGIFPGYLDIPSVKVSDGARYIEIKDIDNRGLALDMNDFELGFLNPLINYDKLNFTGSLNSKVSIQDIFNIEGIEGYIDVPDFKINDDDYGELIIRAKRGTVGQNMVVLDMSIQKDTQNLYASGWLNIDSSILDVSVALEDYPMSFFEYIIEEGISRTSGQTDINVRLHGALSDLKMDGVGIVKDAGVRVDFLGAYYRMDQALIKIDESFIDFNGVELIDELDQKAVISGGLRHHVLADIRADLKIQSPRFIGLNTTIEDNPLYYGLGVGELEITFKGPFDAIDIGVDGKLGDLSKLYIPLNSSDYTYDESFITYTNEQDSTSVVEQDSVQSLAEILKEKGVDFEMNLEFTQDAVVSIIYDESTNNILEGTGEGIIDINVRRDGEFTAYGNYNILSGRYLYTAYGVIAKPFVIQDVGTVVWTGDPYNANLNVTATANVRAQLTNLLQEFSGGTITDAQLSTRRDINLKLILTGELFSPDINFDIEFPNLTGELRTYAENKIRTLRSVPNGLNNQVVGLMIFSNFLPESDAYTSLSGGEIGATGNNTLTQYLTSQLSIFFSDYLSSKLGDDDFIKAIDFEIAVAQNNSPLGDDATVLEGLLDVVPDEVQLKMKNHFKNDNFVLNIGGNFVRDAGLGQTQENYVTGDFSLDWYITEDRRLKVRFYGQYDYDDVETTSFRQRYGFGINYRKEFGSVTDFMDDIVEDLRRLQREEQQKEISSQ